MKKKFNLSVESAGGILVFLSVGLLFTSVIYNNYKEDVKPKKVEQKPPTEQQMEELESKVSLKID